MAQPSVLAQHLSESGPNFRNAPIAADTHSSSYHPYLHRRLPVSLIVAHTHEDHADQGADEYQSASNTQLPAQKFAAPLL